MAFFVGSAVDIPAISSLCVYAGCSFLANYVLQFLLFVPFMVIDSHRIRSSRNAWTPCFYRHSTVTVEVEIPDVIDINPDDNPSPSTAIGTLTPTCNGTSSSTQSEVTDSYLSAILLPVMTKRVSRWAVILTFCITLSLSIYAIPQLSIGGDPENYFPDDSPALHSIEVISTIWNGAKFVEHDIVMKQQDFSQIAVRDTVYELMADLESQDDALDAVTNWLDEFELFLNETGLDLNDDALDSTAFYSELQAFSNGTYWDSEIVYDDPLSPTLIELTRFKLSAIGAPLYIDGYREYLVWNDIFHEYLPLNEDGYLFQKDALIGYFMNIILSLTASNMVAAGLGVFAVLALSTDLRMALFLLAMVSMIDLHLFGWMMAFSISLDGTVYVVLVMAVGLTVDYMIHITHSFAEAQPKGDRTKMDHHEIYRAKLKAALDSMGVSVWSVLRMIFYFDLNSNENTLIPFIQYLQQRRVDHVHRHSVFGGE